MQAVKRGLQRGTGSGLGDQCLACLFQGIGQILPGDGMIDDVGSTRILRGKAAFQPVYGVGLFDLQAVLHRDPQRGGDALQTVGLVGPDIGHQAQTILGR
ncbi:hypothetical protein D3C78_996010 [compost metagenome]